MAEKILVLAEMTAKQAEAVSDLLEDLIAADAENDWFKLRTVKGLYALLRGLDEALDDGFGCDCDECQD